MFFIPIPSNNSKFSFTVDLDGTVYRMTFTFNTRQLSWDLAFAQQDGTVIVSGIKILPAIDLLFRHKDSRLPPGFLTVTDPKNGDKGERPTRSSLFNNEIRLVYLTEADFDIFQSVDTFQEAADASV